MTKGGKTISYLAAVTTYYFRNPEEALKRAKAAGEVAWLLVWRNNPAFRQERLGSL